MKKILFVLIGVFLASCNSDDSSSIVQEQEQEYLCVDQIAQDFEVSEVTHNSASLNWNFSGNISPLSFEAVYGETGFSIENGTTITDIDCVCVTIEGLSSNTSYQLYVRARCSDTEFSEYSLPREFTTLDCPIPEVLYVHNITNNTARLNWANYSENYEVEYGVEGFDLGSGIILQTNNSFIDLTGLSGGTSYDAYVKSLCGNNESSYSEVETFITDYNCNKPLYLDGYNEYLESLIIYWNHNGENSWQIEYGLYGFEIGTGIKINTSEEPYQIYNLQNHTTYQIYVRAICSGGGYSEDAGIVLKTEW